MMNATMLQMMRSYPSTIAPILDGDWRDTMEPVQFEYRGRRLAVGSIVHKQKLSGVKKLNLSAADEQFEQLLIAAALMANAEGDINLVCGFPKHTIAQNTQLLKTYKNRRFEIPTPSGARFDLNGTGCFAGKGTTGVHTTEVFPSVFPELAFSGFRSKLSVIF